MVLYAKLTCELIDVSNELECEVGFSLDEGFVVIKVVMSSLSLSTVSTSERVRAAVGSFRRHLAQDGVTESELRSPDGELTVFPKPRAFPRIRSPARRCLAGCANLSRSSEPGTVRHKDRIFVVPVN